MLRAGPRARPLSRLVLLVSLMVLALAGCGGGGGDGGSDAGSGGTGGVDNGGGNGGGGEGGGTEPTPPTVTHRSWQGRFEFGQTQVVGKDEKRLAPKLVPGRNTLLLFTPDAPIANDMQVFVEATRNRTSLGRYYLARPDRLPGYVEDSLSFTDLPRYSTQAWSVLMPAGWIEPGVSLTVGYDAFHAENNHIDAYRIETALPTLAAPSTFTVARAKFLLWGDDGQSMDTLDAKKLAHDYFAVLPVSDLRVVDYTPARWGYVVWQQGASAPARFDSYARLKAATDGKMYGWVKTMGIRASLANTGRGLLTGVYGDNSPYSYGTYVAMGRYRDGEGKYRDMANDVAGGWTGWSAIWWNSECGNAFIHEVGHSYTLAHFTGGTAKSWGIADEYPLDGVYLPSHPQPFDTVRGKFRTWYQVNGGPVAGGTAQGLAGKADPMNGGDSPNAQTCFPPYTAYHTGKIQSWLDTTPTFLNQGDKAGVFVWDAPNSRYKPAAPATNALVLAQVDVPVATLIGTLAANSSPRSRQIYPALYAAKGNTFHVPYPFGRDLPELYQGARYFVELTYADGRSSYALIPQKQITNPSQLVHFSLNVALGDKPVQATLYEANQAYPGITLANSTALFTRAIDSQTSVPPVVEMGSKGLHQSPELSLSTMCMQGSCERDSTEVAWYPAEGTQLYFVARDGQVGATTAVTTPDAAPMTLSLPVQSSDGKTYRAIARVQRTVNTPTGYRAFPANDRSAAPTMLQGNLQRLVLWIARGDNPELPPGVYATAQPVTLDVHAVDAKGDSHVDEVSISARFAVPDIIEAGIAEPVYRGGYRLPNSSIYFTTPDPRQGPTRRVWSFDGAETPVRVQMRDTVSGASQQVTFRAQRFVGGQNGYKFNMNSGGYYYTTDSEYGLRLRFVAADNPDLKKGHRYLTESGKELVVDAHGWHNPVQVGRFAVRWDFVAP